MARTNPVQFIQQVRAEVGKVRLAVPPRSDADNRYGADHGRRNGNILHPGGPNYPFWSKSIGLVSIESQHHSRQNAP